MSREDHVRDIHVAREAIGRVQERIAGATEAAEEALNAVAVSTGGEQSGSQSGQAAFSKAARVPSLLNDAYACLAEVVRDLEAYVQEI